MVPLSREERTACFISSSSPPFLICGCVLVMYVCLHTASPLFSILLLPSKPSPERKKKSTNCLLHSLLVSVCVSVFGTAGVLLLAAVYPDKTVCCSLLTTHYVYRRTLPFFFLLLVFVYTRKNGSYLIRYKFLHSSPFYEHFNPMLLIFFLVELLRRLQCQSFLVCFYIYI